MSGAEGFTTEEEQEMLYRIEKQLKVLQKVLMMMIRRGELQHRMQRKMLYRLK